MDFLQILRFALRTLRRSWTVTLLATVSLALAIAGNITVYSLINGLLNRPLPYPEADRLVLLTERSPELPPGQPAPVSAANFLDWRERQTSFEDLAGVRAQPLNLDRGGEAPESITAAAVSPELFPMLRAEVAMGRVFAPEEGLAGNHHVAVVSHEFWLEELGSSKDLAGQVLTLNGEPYEVIGVLGEDFELILAQGTRIWVPLALDRATAKRQIRDTLALGRLQPGVAESAAEAEMATIGKALADEYPAVNRGYVIEALNLRHDIPDSRNRLFLRMVQWALIFVLLIACANVANLLLARSRVREREMAIRTSIGASRRRIVAQLLTESMVMAAAAGVVGVGLGYLGVGQLGKALGAQLPKAWMPVVDARVVAYGLGVTVLGGLLFGLAPVLQLGRFDLVGALKDGTQAATQGGRRRWASAVLVVGEIALALMFLGGTSVMIRSFQALQGADAGFETAHLMGFQVALPEVRYGTPEELDTAVEQLGTRLAGLPGVAGVSMANVAPRWPFMPRDGVAIDARPLPAEQALPRAAWLTVEPGYFETLGIPLRRGRALAPADTAEAPAVAVINESAARKLWGGDDPLGQRLTILGTSREVVGVVADVRHEILLVGDDFLPTVYFPLAQQPAASFIVALRTVVPPGDLKETSRAEVLRFDPQAVVTNMTTMDDFVEQFWVGQHLFTAILGGFGTLALLLAALGTYGVLAYSVVQRTHEIGVRMAIGAGRWQVVRMITRHGLFLGLVGIALGTPFVFAIAKLFEQVLAGLVPVEPGSVVGAGAILVLSTLLASLLPAFRASGIDPIRALRWE